MCTYKIADEVNEAGRRAGYALNCDGVQVATKNWSTAVIEGFQQVRPRSRAVSPQDRTVRP